MTPPRVHDTKKRESLEAREKDRDVSCRHRRRAYTRHGVRLDEEAADEKARVRRQATSNKQRTESSKALSFFFSPPLRAPFDGGMMEACVALPICWREPARDARCEYIFDLQEVRSEREIARNAQDKEKVCRECL
jgi:hypothetical protein